MDKTNPVKHILVLVDGTEASFRAADFAIALAYALQAKLTAMAVVETETLRQLLNVKILSKVEMGEFEKELHSSSERQIAEVHERALRKKLVIDDVIVEGNSEEVVPREVATRQVDLIALGGFQSNRASRDLLTRQRQQIVDHTVCPVVVVK
jgi:nucleotide-binding universal stress UspA family protein